MMRQRQMEARRVRQSVSIAGRQTNDRAGGQGQGHYSHRSDRPALHCPALVATPALRTNRQTDRQYPQDRQTDRQPFIYRAGPPLSDRVKNLPSDLPSFAAGRHWHLTCPGPSPSLSFV
mmetsp:Transcript_22985/g.56828  ORF Transcript_22985/g.56828 Transcript_22985/m.56828 type:complete len:119 (+) Transcript_22985:1771-2127(+)